MRLRRVLVAFIFVVFSSSVGLTSDWFDFDRNEALRRIRNAIDKMEALAPIPDLQCIPKPAILRPCVASINNRISFSIVDTFSRDEDEKRNLERIRQFQAGNPGFVYEISTTLKIDGATHGDYNLFDTLCVAAMLALRPKLSIDDARRRYATALRHAVNKSGNGDGEEIVVGNPDTLVMNVAPRFEMSCTISAEDDYRL